MFQVQCCCNPSLTLNPKGKQKQKMFDFGFLLPQKLNHSSRYKFVNMDKGQLVEGCHCKILALFSRELKATV